MFSYCNNAVRISISNDMQLKETEKEQNMWSREDYLAREEYLANIRRDLARLQGNTANTDSSSDNKNSISTREDDPREEYLANIQRDLARLQGNTVDTDSSSANKSHASVTVTTTNGNTTVVTRTTQPSVGNITVSVGCLDFSRKDPHVPDGVSVDGVLVTEISGENNSMSRNAMKR